MRTFATVMPRPFLRANVSRLPWRDTRIITVTATIGRWSSSSISSTWTFAISISGTCFTMEAIGRCRSELIVVFEGVPIQATGFRTGTTNIRVCVRIAGLSIPFVVLSLIKVLRCIDILIISSIDILVRYWTFRSWIRTIYMTVRRIVVFRWRIISFTIQKRAALVFVFVITFVRIVTVERLWKDGQCRWIRLRWQTRVSTLLMDVILRNRIVEWLSLLTRIVPNCIRTS